MPEKSYVYPAQSKVDKLLGKPAINFEEFDEVKSKPKPKDKRDFPLLEDLQANILKHHKRKYSGHIFISFKEGKQIEVRNFIKKLDIISAKKQLGNIKNNKPKDLLTSFFLSYQGYIYLGIPHWSPTNCPSFRKGVQEDVIKSFDKNIDKDFEKKSEHAMIFTSLF